MDGLISVGVINGEALKWDITVSSKAQADKTETKQLQVPKWILAPQTFTFEPYLKNAHTFGKLWDFEIKPWGRICEMRPIKPWV